jgi:amino acid transporter
VLVLIGALCFAELASTYPRSGGEYVYLTRTYGSAVGYLFAWAQFTVIRPGSIGALAYIFAMYAAKLMNWEDAGILPLAVLAVVCLTTINVLGVTLSTTAQNLLTVAKVIGLIGIIGIGWFWGNWDHVVVERRTVASGWLAWAMIEILWVYAGWHECAYVAAEVKSPRRNLPVALLLGTLCVTVIYLLINGAYLLGLGLDGAGRKTVAADLVALAWPGSGPRVVSLLIVISALGAINGMIFTTARMFAEFGVEHRVFRPLTHWSRSWGTPVRALVVQCVVAVAVIVGVALVRKVGEGSDGLYAMIAVTAATFWVFFFLTGLALMILRSKDPDVPRPFRVPLYPILPIIFCASCGYMVYGSIEAKPVESLIGLGILLVGLPFYFMPQRRRPAPLAVAPEPEPVGSGHHA